MSSALPERGRNRDSVLQDLAGFASDDPKYREGRVWSLVYYLDEAHSAFLAEAYEAFSSANGLNPTVFKSLKRFESEIISATAELLQGGDGVCGVLTSGGTESCLLAAKTYRDLARRTRPVRKPEMILPTTAHVAWFKAAEYFDIRPRLLPLDKALRADVGRLEAMINRNTVMIVGSAPEYPHGMIDPIAEMGAIAQRHGIPLHVDACVGGFILPFMEMNGIALPPWNYRVPGVTSISADLHKYGFAAKGASTITYRNLDYLKHQMFVYENWPGGLFVSPAILGTRPGGAYAAAWAAMQHFGKTGYRELAKRTIDAFSRIKDGINAIPELHVLGDPQGPLLGYGSRDRDVSIYAVGDQMEARGWQVNRLQFPEGLHAMVTARHAGIAEDYLGDLKAAVAAVKADPSLAGKGGAATYGLMANVPMRGLVRQRALEIFSNMYRPGGGSFDLTANAAANTGAGNGLDGNRRSLLERIALWYVARKRRRGG